jgi:hypothetical protein
MRWFIAEDGKVDADHVQFGPLATREAAFMVRHVIETVEDRVDLWVVRDDDHLLTYDRFLMQPRAEVTVRDTHAHEAGR